ncbi:MAG: OmpA family protein [bacterium]|nr:OmpA family protein [bacterium]
MKTQFKCYEESRKAGSSILKIKKLASGILILLCASSFAQVQKDSIVQPSWWFGVAAGANFNFYDGSTQKLNSDLTVPSVFHKGNGIGLFLAPSVEFHRPDLKLGVIIQAGYDGRSGKFNQIVTPCNCPADLTAHVSYVTLEPSLRIAPFGSSFYIYGGPRFAYNIGKSFVFQQSPNPDYPEQVKSPEVTGDFSDVKSTLVSMQIGMGYDIAMTSKQNKTQFMISPFAAYHPYFGQSPRSIETWNISTVRVGIVFKFGKTHVYDPKDTALAKNVQKEALAPAIVPVVLVVDTSVHFSVYSPKNLPTERRVRETFPIRNYVFFDLGSSEIPSRYVLLKKDQVKDFKEDQLEVFKPKRLSGRSDRQMIAYYNVLNILGDRMGKYPASTINLVGSSEYSIAEGKAMSESVKKYLVTVFGIDASRISTEGRLKPQIPSEATGGTKDLFLMSEGNHRVSIESSSSPLLMEFQSGPDAPLKPVELSVTQTAPLDSYVTFKVNAPENVVSSWTMELTDDKGKVQKFGPYTQSSLSLPGKSILGTKAEGNYKIVMYAKNKKGKISKQETTAHIVLWTPPTREQGMRFSVIFEYNESNLSPTYEKYLSEIVTPKIPKGATVTIHGYTDIVGSADYNLKLSLTRAQEVKDILYQSLMKAGTKEVTFVVRGMGEDEKLSPFENRLPEERFYNRTVVMDIVPKE